MNSTERIAELNRQIEIEQRTIDKCSHQFAPAFYDPEVRKEPQGFKTEVQGSDIWTVATDYKDVDVPRWSRICTKCGYKQSTYTQKTKTVIEGPSFKDSY